MRAESLILPALNMLADWVSLQCRLSTVRSRHLFDHSSQLTVFKCVLNTALYNLSCICALLSVAHIRSQSSSVPVTAGSRGWAHSRRLSATGRQLL